MSDSWFPAALCFLDRSIFNAMLWMPRDFSCLLRIRRFETRESRYFRFVLLTFPLIGHFDTYLREIVSGECSLRVTGDCLPALLSCFSLCNISTQLPPHTSNSSNHFHASPSRACKLHLTVCVCKVKVTYLASRYVQTLKFSIRTPSPQRFAMNTSIQRISSICSTHTRPFYQ